MEEENLSNHRKIGNDQELFFFDGVSPGSCFWLPNGTKIFNKLQNMIRDEYYTRGFDEIMTPIMAKNDLWKISGHYDQYKKNMFFLSCDETEYALSAMNCPKHCIVFKHKTRSYKELPLRYSDCGTLHRNEISGSLTGLTRVRMFKQDDAHSFIAFNQIKSEISFALKFLSDIYDKFGFKYQLNLSTRPEEFIGDIETWNEAEQMLTEALNEGNIKWTIDPQNGAFYGPKIDVHICDSLGKKHQCGTIQLDFQLPKRFGLQYVDENGEFQTPVMIHRAIFGSFERFIAILIEHFNGDWPLWLSPRQIKIVPVSEKFLNYAKQVKNDLMKHKFYIDVDESNNTLKKKIRDAEIEKYNYILVVGQQEVDSKSVNVRSRDNTQKKMLVQDFVIEVQQNINEFN